MKKSLFFAVMLCLSAMAALGQAKPADFSGTWVLDVPKSQLGERARIESMTMTVAQTDKELKVTTETKRPAPPADAPAAGPGGAGGRGVGRGLMGDGTVAYSLDGKETVVEIDGPNGKMPIRYTGKIDEGKANILSVRSISGPMGELTVTTKEVWSISADGKTLTVVRDQTTPRGSNNSTLVFAKK